MIYNSVGADTQLIDSVLPAETLPQGKVPCGVLSLLQKEAMSEGNRLNGVPRMVTRLHPLISTWELAKM